MDRVPVQHQKIGQRLPRGKITLQKASTFRQFLSNACGITKQTFSGTGRWATKTLRAGLYQMFYRRNQQKKASRGYHWRQIKWCDCQPAGRRLKIGGHQKYLRHSASQPEDDHSRHRTATNPHLSATCQIKHRHGAFQTDVDSNNGDVIGMIWQVNVYKKLFTYDPYLQK